MELIGLACRTRAREFPPIISIAYSNASIGRTGRARANLAGRVWGWRLSNIWRRPMAERLLSSRDLVRGHNSRSSSHGSPLLLGNGSLQRMPQSKMRRLLSGKAGRVLRVLQIL